jgi:hypothetical protein
VVDVTQQDERLGILDVDFNIHTAFQLSTLTGTLCAEPLLGVCYIVEDVIVNTDEMVGPSGEATDGELKGLYYMNYKSFIIHKTIMCWCLFSKFYSSIQNRCDSRSSYFQYA